MTKKYICNLCDELCVLEVEESVEKPYVCPFNEIKGTEWELMKKEG